MGWKNNGNERNGRTVEPLLGMTALFLLLIGCFVVMRPFLTALIWSAVLAFALWPIQAKFTRWFGGRPTLAAMLVTLMLTLVLVGPFVLIGMSLGDDARALGTATLKWAGSDPGEPPKWLARIPVIGEETKDYWDEFSRERKRWLEQLNKAAMETPPKAKPVIERNGELVPVPEEIPAIGLVKPTRIPKGDAGVAADATPDETAVSSRTAWFMGSTVATAQIWLIAVGKAILQGVTSVLLSVFLTFFLLRGGASIGVHLRVGMGLIAGKQGQHLLKVAGDTVIGVVYGILGTALVQAVVAGVGFEIAGVPAPVLLAVITFFFSAVPLGPPLVWIPAAIWLFAQGSPGWGVFMLFYGTLGISGVDNVVKPYLISQGSKMPFILIFCGVIGGALAFGLVGVFLGPTMLAVAFRMIEEWSSGRQQDLDAKAAAAVDIPV
jgi:predicted PurR-regulated permease PerM